MKILLSKSNLTNRNPHKSYLTNLIGFLCDIFALLTNKTFQKKKKNEEEVTRKDSVKENCWILTVYFNQFKVSHLTCP